MSDENGNNWRDPKFHIADIVLRYNEWRKDYFMPPPYQWLDELLGECVRLRTEVERLEADRATAVVQTESDYQHEIDTLRAEVERLRDVVRQLTTSLLSRPVGSEQERLPPQPALTDAEREAVEFAVAHGETVNASWRYTLRGLLARMGGERVSERSVGCHCDLEPGQQPTGCVFDGHEPVENCSVAMRLRAEGKSQAQCEHWKPVQPSEMEQLRAEVARLRLTDAERATLYHLRDWLRHIPDVDAYHLQHWLRHIPDVDALLARLGGGA